MFIRKQLFQGSGLESLFLWGARQTGKSTLLKEIFPDSLWFDLLQTDVFERLQRNPAQLREIILADTRKTPVVIDEIQRIPELLNEIHWLIENNRTRFAARLSEKLLNILFIMKFMPIALIQILITRLVIGVRRHNLKLILF